jgi:hypothetical protein
MKYNCIYVTGQRQHVCTSIDLPESDMNTLQTIFIERYPFIRSFDFEWHLQTERAEAEGEQQEGEQQEGQFDFFFVRKEEGNGHLSIRCDDETFRIPRTTTFYQITQWIILLADQHNFIPEYYLQREHQLYLVVNPHARIPEYVNEVVIYSNDDVHYHVLCKNENEIEEKLLVT